jgi:transposase
MGTATQRRMFGTAVRVRRLAAIAILATLIIAAPAAAAAPVEPTLSVSPDPVNSGGAIYVDGTNHCRQVTINIANKPDLHIESVKGSFRVKGNAPRAPGTYAVSSYCEGEPGEEYLVASAQFTVKQAVLSLKPTSVTQSEALAITITSPPACIKRPLYLVSTATQSNPIEVEVTWKGDPDRLLTTHAVIANDMKPGAYLAKVGCTAFAGAGDRAPPLEAEFTVKAANPSTTPTPTPGTPTPTQGQAGNTTGPRPSGSPTAVFPSPTGTVAPIPAKASSQPRAALASWLRPPSDPGLHSLRRVVITLALAVLLVLLIGFPAQIFESTLENNYERVVGPLRRIVRRWQAPQLPRSVVFAGFVVLATALYALTDPSFGHDGNQTVLDAVGFFVAIPLVTLAFEVPVELYSRRGRRHRATFQVLPLALVVAVACALVSYVGHFQPGYVYGLIAGYAALRTRELSAAESGRAVLVGAAVVFSMVLLCWVAWDPIDQALTSSAGGGAGRRVLDSVLATTVVVGVQALAFQLLPMTFLDGKTLVTWNRRSWQIIYAIALFSLMFVTFWPRTRNEGVDPQVISVMALFLAFGAFSLAFWRISATRRLPVRQCLGGVRYGPAARLFDLLWDGTRGQRTARRRQHNEAPNVRPLASKNRHPGQPGHYTSAFQDLHRVDVCRWLIGRGGQF